MQTFVMGYVLLCIGGVLSGVSGIIGSTTVGWLALTVGVVGVGYTLVGLSKLFRSFT